VAHAVQDTAYGLAGALVVHSLLLIALILNLDWISADPPPVQAELWSSLPPERSLPTASPEPAAKAPPTPKPEPTPNADLAIERRKEADRKAAERKSEDRKAAERKTAERKEAERREADRLERERAAELKRLGIDPKAKAADKGKDASTKAGVAAGSAKGERTGREAEWADRVRGLLESRVRYRGVNTTDLEVEILLLPTGQLQSVRLLGASNAPSYDQAVLEAIRSMTFPKPPEGVRSVTLKMRHRAEGQ
jgi:colicin import membrane protein